MRASLPFGMHELVSFEEIGSRMEELGNTVAVYLP